MISVLATLWVFVLVWIAVQRADVIENKKQHLLQLATVLDEQTMRLFMLLENSLRASEHWLSTNPGARGWDDPAFVQLVTSLVSSSGGIFKMRVADREGNLHLVPGSADDHVVRVEDREYYLNHTDPGKRGLQISKPIRSKLTGRWILILTIPVDNPRSESAMVIGVLDLERLVALQEDLRPKPGGSVTLLRSDGTVLARSPFLDSLIGMDLSGFAAFQDMVGAKNQGVYLSESPATDNRSRLIAFAKVDGLPLIVNVSMLLDETLEPWRRGTAMVLLITTSVTLVALPALRKIIHLMRENDRARHELHLLATTDDLTGLLNRRAFLAAASREFSRSRRHGRPMSVVMADLDFFKAVNDTYGHAMGDMVLRTIGRTVTERIRAEDFAGRMGGEEFCVAMPESGMDAARTAAERLRGEIWIPGDDQSEPYRCPTFSIGIATMRDEDRDFYDVLMRADDNLYTAKKQGRDRIHAV